MAKYKYLSNPTRTSVSLVYKRHGTNPLDIAETKTRAIARANKLYRLNSDIVIIPKYSYAVKKPYVYEIFGSIRQTKDVTTRVGRSKIVKTMIKTPTGWIRLSSTTHPEFYGRKKR